jgi:hypothetical protein
VVCDFSYPYLIGGGLWFAFYVPVGGSTGVEDRYDVSEPNSSRKIDAKTFGEQSLKPTAESSEEASDTDIRVRDSLPDALAEFHEKFERDLNTPPDERFVRLSMAIRMAVREGLAVDVIEKVERAFGPGRARSVLLSSCFSEITSSDVAKRCLDGLDFAEDIAAAKKGIREMLQAEYGSGEMTDFAFLERFSFVGDVSILKSDVAKDKMIRQDLLARTGDPNALGFRDVFDEVVKWGLTADEANRTLREISTLAPFDSWELLKESELATNRDFEAVALNMARNDPERALKTIIEGDLGIGILRDAMGHWLEFDGKSPFRWLSENEAAISSEKSDLVRAAIVDFSVSADKGEFDMAREWANTITDDSLRLKVINEINLAHGGLSGEVSVPEN